MSRPFHPVPPGWTEEGPFSSVGDLWVREAGEREGEGGRGASLRAPAPQIAAPARGPLRYCIGPACAGLAAAATALPVLWPWPVSCRAAPRLQTPITGSRTPTSLT